MSLRDTAMPRLPAQSDNTRTAARKVKGQMTITTKPTAAGIGGTFTFTAHVGRKTGVSDPVPNNATIGKATAAFLQAYQRAGMTIPANKLPAAAIAVITQELRAARNHVEK